MHSMMFRSNPGPVDATAEESNAPNLLFPTLSRDTKEEDEETTLIKTIGWISAGLGAVAIGLVIGREIRQRYKFNRRTPYDAYAHSGDEPDIDFGLGI
jgi:hypothetical protein